MKFSFTIRFERYFYLCDFIPRFIKYQLIIFNTHLKMEYDNIIKSVDFFKILTKRIKKKVPIYDFSLYFVIDGKVNKKFIKFPILSIKNQFVIKYLKS